jgi:hypothetical protein
MFNDKLQSLSEPEKEALFNQIYQTARKKNNRKELTRIKQEYGTLDVEWDNETPASLLAQEKEFKALRILLDYHVDTYWITKRCVKTQCHAGVKFLLEQDVISINLPACWYAEEGKKEKVNILRRCGANINWIVWGYAVSNYYEQVKELLAANASRDWACDGYATGCYHERVDELFSNAKDDNDLARLQRRAIHGAAAAEDKDQVNKLLKELKGDTSMRESALFGYAAAGYVKAITDLIKGDPTLSESGLLRKAIRGYAKGGHHDLLLPQMEMDELSQAMQGYAEGGYPTHAENMFNTARGLEPAHTKQLLLHLLCASATGGHYAQTAVFFNRYNHDKEVYYAYAIAHAYAKEDHVAEFKQWVAEQKLEIGEIKKEYLPLINPIAEDDKKDDNQQPMTPVPPKFLLHWHFSDEPPIDKALSLLAKVNTVGRAAAVANFFRRRSNPHQKIEKICQQNKQHPNIEQLCTQINNVLPLLDEKSELAQCINFIERQINANNASDYVAVAQPGNSTSQVRTSDSSDNESLETDEYVVAVAQPGNSSR